jgi:hypothetical protein
VGRDENLASSLTLCRFENWASPQSCWDISRVLVEIFIESFSALPAELILDFDGTDDLIHGDQPGAVFHGYYDHPCFLPLYVFCADKLLAAYRRPGDTDGAQHAWGILALLVKRLRQVWPQVHIVFRGDSGFCRDQMLRCCERRGVSYVVGPVPNSRLNEMAAPWIDRAEAGFEHSGQKKDRGGDYPQYSPGENLVIQLLPAAVTVLRGLQAPGGCVIARKAIPKV